MTAQKTKPVTLPPPSIDQEIRAISQICEALVDVSEDRRAVVLSTVVLLLGIEQPDNLSLI